MHAENQSTAVAQTLLKLLLFFLLNADITLRTLSLGVFGLFIPIVLLTVLVDGLRRLPLFFLLFVLVVVAALRFLSLLDASFVVVVDVSIGGKQLSLCVLQSFF